MKNFNLGQTIQIIANVGVIAGIVFLALELRQNNELLRAEADFNYSQRRMDNREFVYADPEIAALTTKFTNNEPLTEVEQLRIDRSIERTMIGWQWEYGQIVDGNTREGGDETATRWRTELQRESAFSRRFRYVWAYFHPQLRRDFVDWMNENVLE